MPPLVIALLWGTSLALFQLVLQALFTGFTGAASIAALAALVWPGLWYRKQMRPQALAKIAERQRTRQVFISLIEASMDGAVVFDEQGAVVALNCAAVKLFGQGQAYNINVEGEHRAPDKQDLSVTSLLDWPQEQHWCNKTSSLRGEILGHRAGDDVFPAEVTCIPLRGEAGETYYCAHVRDMSEQHHLTRVGHLLRTCIGYISDAVIVTESSPLDKPGPRIIFANEAVEKMTGYTPDELLGQTPRVLQGPETDPQVLARIRDALESQKPVHEEVINYTRSGDPFWMEMRIIPVPPRTFGSLSYFVAVGRDVTERREQQCRLEQSEHSLQRTNHALQTVREEERARIARDLHDDLGQTLTAIKLELGLLLESDEPLTSVQRSKLQRLVGMTDGAVDQIRDIAANLRPSLLDHMGFVGAAQWYINDVDQRLAADVSFEAGPGSSLPLGADAAVALYRILQEALTNACRHSAARRVHVSYSAPGRRPRLSVSDDGCGFDLAEVELAGTLGLVGLRERVENLGGELTIDAAPGRGCTLTIQLTEQYEKNQDRSR